MKLTEYTINDFMDILASDAPAPGGGSASALAGAVGAALTGMVAALTAGKEKYKEYETVMRKILEEAATCKDSFLQAIHQDTEAFNGVTDVFKMPKETEEDKTARKAAMQDALKDSARIPLTVMEYALTALETTEKCLGKSNPNVTSDLGVSALNLKSAVQGAWLNVLINLQGIRDEAFVTEYRTRGEGVLNKASCLADKIYMEILGTLQ